MTKTLNIIIALSFFFSCSSKNDYNEDFYNKLSNSEDYIIYSKNKNIEREDFYQVGEFSYYMGVATKMNKNDTNLDYKVYFSKNESFIPENIEQDLLSKNLFLTNKSFQIFKIEAMKEANYLKNNNKSPKTLNDLKNISEKINTNSWKRIDSLRYSLQENFDTIKTNKLLDRELDNLSKKKTFHNKALAQWWVKCKVELHSYLSRQKPITNGFIILF